MNDPLLMQRVSKAHRDRISESAIYKYEHSYRRFEEWMADHDLTARAVSPQHFEQFVYDMTSRYKVSTVRGMVTRIKAAYDYDRKINPQTTPPDPTATYRLPPEAEAEKRILSIDELRATRDACKDETERLLFYCLAYTGCRLSEVRHLKWTDIDFTSNSILVIGKGGKLRHVPLHSELKRVLLLTDLSARERYVVTRRRKNVTDCPLHIDSVSWIVSEFFARAGIQNATSHAFRKTVATTLLRAGSRYNVRELTIEKIMGWAPSTIAARHYWDVPAEDLHAAIHVLYPGGL